MSTAQEQMQAIMFSEIENGTWVEGGCDKCKRGMTGGIYRFQREFRKEGTMCMTCSKKITKKQLKDFGNHIE